MPGGRMRGGCGSWEEDFLDGLLVIGGRKHILKEWIGLGFVCNVEFLVRGAVGDRSRLLGIFGELYGVGLCIAFRKEEMHLLLSKTHDVRTALTQNPEPFTKRIPAFSTQHFFLKSYGTTN